MRLLIYYKPNKDKFILNYNEDRQSELKKGSVNNYGHIIINYVYEEDNKIFFDKRLYEKYKNKKWRKIKRKQNLRYRIGQKIIDLGIKISFGKVDRSVFTHNKHYQWWIK